MLDLVTVERQQKMLLNPARASLSREAAAAPPGLFCSIILGCCYSSLARRQATGHSSLGISLILGFPRAQGPAGGSHEPGLAPGEGSSVAFVTHGVCRVPSVPSPRLGQLPLGLGLVPYVLPGSFLVLNVLEKGMGEPQFLYSCLALPSEVEQGGTF